MASEIINIDGIFYAGSNCITCGVRYFVAKATWDHQRLKGGFHHCPNGHSQGWHKGDTEEDFIRRERDKLKQDAARLEDEKRAAETRARQAEERERKIKRRVSAGTCPCCQRTVVQLQRHMKMKHPSYGKPDNVVALKASS